METSGLTILLFFVLVFFLLAAFILYLFISRCLTPASQRLTLWLKAQSEADQLVETMAAQTKCVIDGLRPCRRREKMRKRIAQRQRHFTSHLREDNDGGMSTGGGRVEYDEELAMNDIWTRHHRQRMDRSDPQDTGSHPSRGLSINGHGVDGSGEGDGMGGTKNNRPSDEVAGERLWEFVVGWCLIGCIFAGIGLIMGANLRAQNGISGETPWTFDTEDGDSLMDSVVAHVIKIALGIKDFGDQLMEHGIFIFIAGINGFVLVRQRVFVRRRQYETELIQGTMLATEFHKNKERDTEEEEQQSSGFSEHQGEGDEKGQSADDFYDRIGNTKQGDYLSLESHAKAPTSTGSSADQCSRTRDTQVNPPKDRQSEADTSPDFRTMSFVAWFNYLQVGILVIEFLQLFSFPLRELMEFYKQAEKTSVMYESAKTVLNVFRSAVTASAAQVTSLGQPGLQYRDGALSLGNNTLFSFSLSNMSTDAIDKFGQFNATQAQGLNLNQSPDLEWLQNMPLLDNATAMAAPWIKNITASADWIKENLPTWLPNITALMANSSLTAVAQGNLEEIRDLINAAAGVAAQARPLPGNMTISSVNATSNENSKAKPPSKDVVGESDIVMQVVNSLGLQPSINTHDWYLLRFWSCFLAVLLGWIVALSIHGWNRRCRRLRREGRPHWRAISVGWVSCFIPVVSVLYLPILSTFLSSAACQSQAIHAYAYERFNQQQEQARREGHGTLQAQSIFNSIVTTLIDPASTITPTANSLLCTGPQIRPSLYLATSLLAYTLAYLLFMVFLTSFERVPGKGEICFRPNGVAVLKNLGLLLAVDFLLIQSPSQRRFRGLVSIAIMLAMACYTIRMKPCYWNKINYWRTFSFSCVLYASLLVALLCPAPEPDKFKGVRIGGRWVMAPNLKMGHAWTVGGGPKVMLAWIAAGWVILIIIFVVADRVFLRHWTKKKAAKRRVSPDTYGTAGGGGGGGPWAGAGGLFYRHDRPSILTQTKAQEGRPSEPKSTSMAQGGQGQNVDDAQGKTTTSLAASRMAPGSHWSVVDLASDNGGIHHDKPDDRSTPIRGLS